VVNSDACKAGLSAVKRAIARGLKAGRISARHRGGGEDCPRLCLLIGLRSFSNPVHRPPPHAHGDFVGFWGGRPDFIKDYARIFGTAKPDKILETRHLFPAKKRASPWFSGLFRLVPAISGIPDNIAVEIQAD